MNTKYIIYYFKDNQNNNLCTVSKPTILYDGYSIFDDIYFMQNYLDAYATLNPYPKSKTFLDAPSIIKALFLSRAIINDALNKKYFKINKTQVAFLSNQITNIENIDKSENTKEAIEYLETKYNVNIFNIPFLCDYYKGISPYKTISVLPRDIEFFNSYATTYYHKNGIENNSNPSDIIRININIDNLQIDMSDYIDNSGNSLHLLPSEKYSEFFDPMTLERKKHANLHYYYDPFPITLLSHLNLKDSIITKIFLNHYEYEENMANSYRSFSERENYLQMYIPSISEDGTLFSSNFVRTK